MSVALSIESGPVQWTLGIEANEVIKDCGSLIFNALLRTKFQENVTLKNSIVTARSHLAVKLTDLLNDEKIAVKANPADDVSNFDQLKSKISQNGYFILECENQVILCYKKSFEDRLSGTERTPKTYAYDPEKLYHEFEAISGCSRLVLLDCSPTSNYLTFYPTVKRVFDGSAYAENVLRSNTFVLLNGSKNINPVEIPAFEDFQKHFYGQFDQVLVDIRNNRLTATLPKDELGEVIQLLNDLKTFVSNDILADHEILEVLNGKKKIIDLQLPHQRALLQRLKFSFSSNQKKVQFMSNLKENVFTADPVLNDGPPDVAPGYIGSSSVVCPEDLIEYGDFDCLADFSRPSQIFLKLIIDSMKKYCFNQKALAFFNEANNCVLLDFKRFNEAPLLIRRHSILKAMDDMKIPRNVTLTKLLAENTFDVVDKFLRTGELTLDQVKDFLRRILISNDYYPQLQDIRHYDAIVLVEDASKIKKSHVEDTITGYWIRKDDKTYNPRPLLKQSFVFSYEGKRLQKLSDEFNISVVHEDFSDSTLAIH